MWCVFQNIGSLQISLIYMCQQSQLKNGGFGTFVRNTIDYITIDLKPYCLEIHCEPVGIKIPVYNLSVISVYRSPRGNIHRCIFLKVLKQY